MCSRGYYKQKVNIYSSTILCIQATNPSRFKYFIVNQWQTTKYSQRAIIDTIMNISMLVQQHRKQGSPCHISEVIGSGRDKLHHDKYRITSGPAQPTQSLICWLASAKSRTAFIRKPGGPALELQDGTWHDRPWHITPKHVKWSSHPCSTEHATQDFKFVRCT